MRRKPTQRKPDMAQTADVAIKTVRAPRTSKSKAAVSASAPQGRALYAIGDIHGRLDLLRRMFDILAEDALTLRRGLAPTYIFLGDYIDRGPESRQVVDALLAFAGTGAETIFLKGNHEAMLETFVRTGEFLDGWLLNGGVETLVSYGVGEREIALTRRDPEAMRALAAEAIGPEHLAFYGGLRVNAALGDYFFVHAGVRPGVPLAEQDEHDMLWIRHEFLNFTEPFEKVIVHGHTPEMDPADRGNRIGIDTGAFFTGQLTALALQGRKRRFLCT
jgi:serine/threonine protein phosphatase 1